MARINELVKKPKPAKTWENVYKLREARFLQETQWLSPLKGQKDLATGGRDPNSNQEVDISKIDKLAKEAPKAKASSGQPVNISPEDYVKRLLEKSK
jgi:hypothetical protein